MELIRLDSNPNPDPSEIPDDHRQTEYGMEKVEDYDPESSTLKVSFNRFGRGEQRRSNFAVGIDWLDVRGFIREFIEIGHPEALHLQRLIKLAEAIEQAGWPPNDPAPENFWDILPS